MPPLTHSTHSSIWIASYPRSGNTWMRQLMSDVILQNHGFETQETLPIHPDQIIPDYDRDGPDAAIDSRIQLPHPLRKTHFDHRRFNGDSIFIFRQPADSLISFYHFHLRYPNLAEKANQGPDAFCLSHLQEWCRHTRSFLDHFRHDRCFFTCYEQMTAAPFVALSKALEFADIKATPSQINIAIENQSFDKKQARESLNTTQRVRFFRKGKVGSGQQELQPETLEVIDRHAMPLYHQALHVIMLQDLRWSPEVISKWLDESQRCNALQSKLTVWSQQLNNHLRQVETSSQWRIGGWITDPLRRRQGNKNGWFRRLHDLASEMVDPKFKSKK